MARGRIATAICTALLASSIALTASAAPGPGKWRAVAKVPGIVDVVGPRADGRLVLSTHSGLFVMRPTGSPVPYARGPYGYAGSPGEPYLTLGRGHRVPGAGCAFRRDVLFALDPDATPWIVRVDRNGRSSRFADLPAGAFPAGIATDTVGSLVIAFSSRRSHRVRRRFTRSIAAAVPGSWQPVLRTSRAGSPWRRVPSAASEASSSLPTR
jgi:hypothetical protein